jgi:hypothetical protein
MLRSTNQNRVALLLIMGSVLAWGTFHAAGAYFNFEPNSNPWRAVMVLVCVVGFLGFWLLMLSARAARIARRSKDR